MSLRISVNFNLFDILAQDGSAPKTTKQLAVAVGTDEALLGRILKNIAASDLIRETTSGTYEHTSLSMLEKNGVYVQPLELLRSAVRIHWILSAQRTGSCPQTPSSDSGIMAPYIASGSEGGLNISPRSTREIILSPIYVFVGFLRRLISYILHPSSSFFRVTFKDGSGLLWSIIGLFVCSGVLFILLGLQQVFTIGTSVARRIVRVEFFRSRTMLILFACTSAVGTACFVPVYFVPLFFQFTRGDAALDAGVRLLPFIIPCIVMICVNGGVMSAYGLYKPWYTIGGALVLTGGALFYTVGADTSAAYIYAYSILTGLGTGMYLQASFSVAQASVALDMVASASGFITCAQVVGTTIALAIANSVFLNESQRSIIHLLPNISIQEVEAVISGTSTLVIFARRGESQG
ncbi:hypothetical protein HAV15_011624 [Penicillium sp. str. |nr:hypothetical protein HAV15_011624 [Penicillium sp. str. \